MKRKGWLILLGMCLLTSVAFAATVKVITQEAVIRNDKRFFATLSCEHLGSFIEQIREGDWLRVSYQGKQGWIHISAVQEQKVQISPFGQGKAREASQDEVALAGKGFTPEVEKAFREKNPQMRYDLVNQVQSSKVDETSLQASCAQKSEEPGACREEEALSWSCLLLFCFSGCARSSKWLQRSPRVGAYKSEAMTPEEECTSVSCRCHDPRPINYNEKR
jgi:hypothetical protein